MIKAVLFDHWGTVANTKTTDETLKRATDAFFPLLSKKYPNISRDEYVKAREEGYIEYGDFQDETLTELSSIDYYQKFIFSKLGIDDEELAYEAAEIYKILDHDSEPKPGLKETLEKLKNDGYKIAMVSNCWADHPRIEMEKFGLAKYFDHFSLSVEVGYRKPDKRIFMDALNALGVKPEEAVHVGDNPKAGMLGAKNLGITTIFIKHKKEPENNDYLVNSIPEVYDIVKKL